MNYPFLTFHAPFLLPSHFLVHLYYYTYISHTRYVRPAIMFVWISALGEGIHFWIGLGNRTGDYITGLGLPTAFCI